MKAEPSKPWQADVFPDLRGYLKRKRQPPHEGEGRPYPAFGVGVVESLEARRLLSYSFSAGVLTFSGTTSADTIIGYRIVNGQGDKVYIHRNANAGEGGPEVAGPYESSGAGSVTKVVINGGLGNDNIQFEDGDNVAFNHGNTIWNEVNEVSGGDDNDTLRGGPLADTVRGDDDDDSLFGYDGNDILYGGYGGSDTVRGGPGNDLMYGGYGGTGEEVAYDELYGDGGNDILYAEGGADYLNPGDGADFAYGGSGDDVFEGSLDGDVDWLDGGFGTDDVGIADFDYDSPEDSLFNFP